MKVNFNRRYFVIFWLVFVTEVAIAVFYFHRIIRGFVGDILAVPLVYCLLRSFFDLSLRKALIITFSIALIVELSQLGSLITLLGLEDTIWSLVMGNAFDWWDIFCYIVGVIIIVLIEKLFQKNR